MRPVQELEMESAGWAAMTSARGTVWRKYVDGYGWVFVSHAVVGPVTGRVWLPSRGAHPGSLGGMDWKGQLYDTPVAAMAAGHLADWGRA